MTRVLQIVAVPSPVRGGEIGITGPERRAANLAPRWKDAGIEAAICYPRRGRLWDTIAASGVPVVDYEISGKFDLGAISKIAALARAHKAQVIHTQGPAALDLLAVLAARRAGAASMVTRPVMIEDQLNYSIRRRRIYALIDRVVTVKLAGRMVAVSEDGRRHLQGAAGVDVSRLVLIHNGIDPSKYAGREATASDGRADSPAVTLAMAAHLLPYKGWPDFIAVVARLRAENLNIRALAIGEGSQRGELEALVRAKGLDERFTFLGFRSDVAALLQGIDIFLFPSYREGLSVAVIEAMASGLPIVAAAAGGIREQVEEGANGFVVAPGDVDAMTRHCAMLVRDPALRRTMGETSRALARERFSEERMLKEYAACYRELASR